MSKPKERWVWICGFDNWTWEDGYRCYACSRSPVKSEAEAVQALERHLRRCGGRYEGRILSGTVRKLNLNERWTK